jgi:hypothetical protein
MPTRAEVEDSVMEGDIPRPRGAVEIDDLVEPLRLLRQAVRQLERWGSVRQELQDMIKNRLGDSEVGTVAGRPAVTWRGTWRSTMSQRLLKERHPDAAVDVTEEKWVRTFLLLDP